MNTEIEKKRVRILVVDDNRDLHDDFRLIFHDELPKESFGDDDLDKLLEHILDDKSLRSYNFYNFVVDSAYQGREALAMVEQAHKNNNPYSVVFMDVRMPPGWNGIETIRQIWKKYSETEIIICTAYSDFGLEEINQVLGKPHNLLYLKKPFDRGEIKQMVFSIVDKTETINQLKDENSRLRDELKIIKAGLNNV